ncbi:MAG: hypothetical protein Q8L14_27140 [Myxococcales bacterium]|nr:hypothetical protein [Myxococcales bacterium]
MSPSRAAGRVAGQVATIGFITFIGIQAGLALGLIPVTMAWGGTQATLTPSLRVASVVAALVLAGCAVAVRTRAGLTRFRVSRGVRIAAFVITAYLALNVVGNLTSPSNAERLLFGPLSAVLVIACGVVASARLEG